MRDVTKIPVEKLKRDDGQPRTHFDEGELLALGKNMDSVGQVVPIIAYRDGAGHIILDGERRWRAAQLVGIKELDVIELPAKPSSTALHILQMSIEAHKLGLSAMERSDFLQRMKEENAWTITDIVDRLQMKQPLVSKLLSYQRLCDEAKKSLHAGEIDMEKAYVISQESDAETQRRLLGQANGLTRDQLRRHAHGKGAVEMKAHRATFPLASGATVIVQGTQFTLNQAIEIIQEVVKELRLAQRNALDITTASRVFRDKARATP